MRTGALPSLRAAICALVAIAVITLLPQRSFGQKPMPPVGDRHFCEWWQARVGPPAPLAESSTALAESREQRPVSPELRASLEKVGTPELADPDGVRGLRDEVVTAAIGCLLELESDVRPTNAMGVTWVGSSLRLDTAPVNLAALYYISYLYTRNWKHGTAVALRGPGAEYRRSQPKYSTTQSSIHEAYRAYRRWYSQVKDIGLEEARAERLDPLAGSSLYWY